MRKVIAIVGMPGSGKSEVADFFTSKGYAYIRLGQLTLDEIIKQGLEPSEANERIIREMLRRKHGMAAFAKLNFPKIEAQKGNMIVDGLYSWEEYLAFKEKHKNFITIAVYASPKTRHQRLIERGLRHGSDPKMKYRSFNLLEAQSRDLAEIEKLNKGGPIAMADFMVINEGTKKDLQNNLEKIFQTINAAKR